MVNPIQITQPQAYSGGADFSPLAGLYDTYKAAQARATQETALGQLGTDPTSNIGVLLRSKDPKLVNLGLQLQEQQAAGGRSDAYLQLQKDAARRIEEDRALAEKNRAAAPSLYEQMLGGSATPRAAAAAAPSPFPAPVPGQTGLPPGIGAPPPQAPTPAPATTFADRFVAPEQVPAIAPAPFAERFAGAAPAPAPDIPIKAEDTSGGLPEWANLQTPIGRMTDTMVTGRPAAAAGISNHDLGAALANPETRAIAAVFAQNKLNPGTWKVHFDKDSGRVVAVNDKTTEVRDLTPAGGGEPSSKEQRERDLRYADAKRRNLSDEEANYFALNKKTMKEDLSATELNKTLQADKDVASAEAALGSIQRAKALSNKAFQGYGAGALASVTANAPSWFPGHEAGVATQTLANHQIRAALDQLQSAYGRNPSDKEGAIMIKLQGAVDAPLDTRNKILEEAETIYKERLATNKTIAEQMHSGAAFKRNKSGSTPPPTTTASSEKLEAAKWIRDNPNDPRVEQVKQLLIGK